MGRGIFGWSCAELERKIKAAGWTYDSAEGGHRFYVHKNRGEIIAIPWHKRESVSPGVAKNILTIAGLLGTEK